MNIGRIAITWPIAGRIQQIRDLKARSLEVIICINQIKQDGSVDIGVESLRDIAVDCLSGRSESIIENPNGSKTIIAFLAD